MSCRRCVLGNVFGECVRQRAEWLGRWERTGLSPRPLRALPSVRFTVSVKPQSAYTDARPPHSRSAAPTSAAAIGYLSDSSLHNSASLSLALTSFSKPGGNREWGLHSLLLRVCLPATSYRQPVVSCSGSRHRQGPSWAISTDRASAVVDRRSRGQQGGNLSPAVMRRPTLSKWISLVSCQKHLERITQGYTPPPLLTEDWRKNHISDIFSFSISWLLTDVFYFVF